jgi:UDP-glucose 4-epimerase
MRILITGGLGYVGSHTSIVLSDAGHQVVCFDNLSNSKIEVAHRLREIAGRAVSLVEGDIRDKKALLKAITQHSIEAVVHLAGLKAVSESSANPTMYYDNNVAGTIMLIEAMAAAKVKTLVFSSSATVYGQPQYLPVDELHPTSATNPYARTKLMIEEILADVAAADTQWGVAILRYFNPVGAHSSGLIGEDPNGPPNNLMPYISRVAAGHLPELSIFGSDYDTPDGTGVRDYIHVMDLASGHVAALNALATKVRSVSTWNLGTGKGYSVLELVKAFERTNKVSVPYRLVARRTADVATCFASAEKARTELGWKPVRSLEDMCSSSWQFETGRQGHDAAR